MEILSSIETFMVVANMLVKSTCTNVHLIVTEAFFRVILSFVKYY